MTVTAVLLFLQLAQWQFRRAEEKRALSAMNAHRMQLPALSLHGDERLERDRLRYRPVTVTGMWDPDHQILLDNRTRRGQVGYEVLTPLEIEGSGRVVLVNRGWVPVGTDRAHLPRLPLPRLRLKVHGMADRFPVPGMHLRGMEVPTEGWPAVVQKVDSAVVSRRLGRQVLDFQIKMDRDLPNGYVREWRLDHVNPGRNLGYALQWTAFALIALGLWVWHGFRRARDCRNAGEELQMKEKGHG